MVFSSLSFIFIFLSCTLLLYFLPFGRTYKNAVLLLASLFFYAWGEPILVFVMILVAFAAYIGGLFIDRHWFIRPRLCLAWTTVTVIVVLASLVFFKYYAFILENIAKLSPAFAEAINPVGRSINLLGLTITIGNIRLPIGISFYTFQILSYVIDLYRGKVAVQTNFWRLLLYVSFFPQLIAGPIVRYQTVEEALTKRKESLADVSAGARRFITGLAKKVIIANGIGQFVSIVYAGDFNVYGTAMYWLAALAYTLQIYYDFSGYSDMAIGLGKIFGFTFLENFNYPYLATSIKDFWKRWHISLSSWFKDYLYIPLGGSKKGAFRQVLSLLIVWALTGLWHGASWNFLVWGLYYFVLLIIEKFIIGDLVDKIPKPIRWFVTLILVMIGWVIFEFTDFAEMQLVLSNMFTLVPTKWLDMYMANAGIVEAALYFIPGILGMFPLGRKVSKIEEKTAGLVLSNIWHLAIFVLCIIVLISSQYNPFIYFRF